MKHTLFSIFLIALLGCTTKIKAQENTKIEVNYGQLTALPRQDDAMKKWRANRFGQFIHWGLYAIPGGEWNGKIYQGAAEWLKSFAKIDSKDWDALHKQFNPTEYDAKKWAKMAKKMGVKYVTITTKHHEGFCLWPSKYTDFDIEATPYKNDLLGEFVKAYNDEGIDVNFYYSVLDWHDPNWRYKLESEEDELAFENLMKFTQNQLLELIERYPTVKGFWFDGTWDQSWKDNGKFSYDLEKKMKALKPGLVINSRLRADEHGSRHFDSNGILMGDYESGYERRLPSYTDKIVTTRDWECCMTIPENQWGYHKDWSISHVKSSYELIEMLVKVTSLNGNFLLNFGPKGDGSFRDEEITIAKEIGDWMQQYGSAIYNCSYVDFEKQDWGYFTQNMDNGRINMIVFNVPIDHNLTVKLPKGNQLKHAYFLNDPSGEIDFIEVEKHQYTLDLSEKQLTEPTVIVIELTEESSKKFFQKAKI